MSSVSYLIGCRVINNWKSLGGSWVWVAGEYISRLAISSQGGIWFEESYDGQLGMVAKVSSNVIKALAKGCECRFWVCVSRDKPFYAVYALVVYDSSEAPFVVYNFIMDTAPKYLVTRKGVGEAFAFCFIDETDAMVLSSSLRFVSSEGFIRSIERLNCLPLSRPSSNDELFSAMDSFEVSLHEYLCRGEASDFEIGVAKCEFSDFSFNRVSHFNEYVQSTYLQMGDIQGDIQEVQIYQMLSYCFKNLVYHAPNVTTGDKSRELIDVVALNGDGVLLVESKCITVAADSSLETSRQNKNLTNNCHKAIGQIEGAVKAIRRYDVVETDGEVLEIHKSKNIHGIVLISEFIGRNGWHDIHAKLYELSEKHDIKLHVFSLGDFSMTLKLCSRDDSIFTYLDKRFSIVKNSGELEVTIRDPSLPLS